MEVSRRVLQRHLEPARPLRRDFQGDFKPEKVSATKMMNEERSTVVEQFHEEPVQQKPLKARISYSREHLIYLASSPEAQKKPRFLPNHPVVVSILRHPEDLHPQEFQGNDEKQHCN